MKKYFNPALFLDAIRQLRVVGVTYIVILEISAILTCVSTRISYSIRYPTLSSYRPESAFTLLKANPFILLIVFAFASILTLIIFNFLNKRNAGDVYHALPVKRSSLFLSLHAAVLCWIIAGVLISSLTSVAGYMLFMPPGVSFDISSVPITLFYSIASGIFVSAIVALSMSLTGTLFSNVAVAALIALGPRLFIIVFTTSIKTLLPILPDEALPIWILERNNPIFFLFQYVLSRDTDITIFQFIYTLVVGALYLAAALLMFRHRRSETADKSAPNRILQTVFRLTFAMILCLIPCMAILNERYYGYSSPRASSIFTYVVFYVIALVGYFLYELITTRKANNLLKAIPALGILVLLNVGFIGGAIAVRNVTLGDTPSPEDIVGVRFTSINTHVYNINSSNNIKDIRFKDTEILTIISGALENAVNNLNRHDSYSNEAYCTVIIEMRGRTITRKISLSAYDFNNLFSKMSENKEFTQTYKALPNQSEVNISLMSNQAELTTVEISNLYEMLREGVDNQDYLKWVNYIANNSSSYDSSPHRDTPITTTNTEPYYGYSMNYEIPTIVNTRQNHP